MEKKTLIIIIIAIYLIALIVFIVIKLQPPPAKAPITPVGLNISNLTTTSATFSWLDAGKNTVSYIVELKLKTDTTFVQLASAHPTTQYKLTNLQPNTFYQVRVASENKVGKSEFKQLEFLTVALPPVVIGITRKGGDDFQSEFYEWKWNIVPNATRYILEYKQNPSTNILSMGAAEGNIDKLNIPGSVLGHGWSYVFWMKVVTSAGTSATSATINVLTLPDSIYDIIVTNTTETSTDLSWPPAQFDTSDGYIVQYGLSGSGVWSEEIEALTRSIHISGLNHSSRYDVRIAAFNATGRGAFFTWGFMTTLNLTPPKVTGVQAQNSSGTTIFLIWDSLTNNPTYHIQQKLASDPESAWNSSPEIDFSGTYFNITGLLEGTQYSFRIYASVPNWPDGEFSDVLTVSTRYPPGVITGLIGTVDAEAKSVTLSWDPATQAQWYMIEVELNTPNDAFYAVNLQCIPTTITISDGLLLDYEYKFRVSAQGSAGPYFKYSYCIVTIPSGLNTLSIEYSNGGVKATWEAVPGADQYRFTVVPRFGNAFLVDLYTTELTAGYCFTELQSIYPATYDVQVYPIQNSSLMDPMHRQFERTGATGLCPFSE